MRYYNSARGDCDTEKEGPLKRMGMETASRTCHNIFRHFRRKEGTGPFNL
jgi:hypothetical protein